MLLQVIATIGLFVGILFTLSIATKAVHKNNIPAEQVLLSAVGWTVFVAALWIF